MLLVFVFQLEPNVNSSFFNSKPNLSIRPTSFQFPHQYQMKLCSTDISRSSVKFHFKKSDTELFDKYLTENCRLYDHYYYFGL